MFTSNGAYGRALAQGKTTWQAAAIAADAAGVTIPDRADILENRNRTAIPQVAGLGDLDEFEPRDIREVIEHEVDHAIVADWLGCKVTLIAVTPGCGGFCQYIPPAGLTPYQDIVITAAGECGTAAHHEYRAALEHRHYDHRHALASSNHDRRSVESKYSADYVDSVWASACDDVERIKAAIGQPARRALIAIMMRDYRIDGETFARIKADRYFER